MVIKHTLFCGVTIKKIKLKLANIHQRISEEKLVEPYARFESSWLLMHQVHRFIFCHCVKVLFGPFNQFIFSWRLRKEAISEMGMFDILSTFEPDEINSQSLED